MSTINSINSNDPIQVALGGSGRATLTAHSLQVGNATSAVTQIAVGTAGQILQAATTADPAWSTASYPATAAAGTVLYGSATNVVSALAAGTTGYVLTMGATLPGWAAASAGGVPSIAGTPNQLTETGSPGATTLSIPSTFTGPGYVAATTYLKMPITTSTAGQLLIGSSAFLHAYGTDNVTLGIGATGSGAAAWSITGTNNVTIGWDASNNITSSGHCVIVGAQAALNLTSGPYNIAVGYAAGNLWGSSVGGNETSNICIGNGGVDSENNTIHIGTQGTGNGQQNACYIAGIEGVTVSNAAMVTINTSTGQMGSASIPAGTINSITADSGPGQTGPSIALNGTINEISVISSGAGAVIGFSIPSVFIAPGSIASTTTNAAGTNFLMPTTSATAGNLLLNSVRWLHGFGTDQVFLGNNAGNYTLTTGTATLNVGIGSNVLQALTTGHNNVIVGEASGALITTGSFNTSIGQNSSSLITTGSSNTCVGQQAGNSLLTGSSNTLFGGGAGISYNGAESYNIVMGLTAGTMGESGVTRIGSGMNTTSCYIDGIKSVTVSSAQYVTINTLTGQMGSVAIPGASSFTWTVTTVNASMVAANGYIANKAGLLTMTLPATATVGDLFEITNINTAAGWKIAQNASQSIRFGNVVTTVGTGGSLASVALGDSLRIVCTATNNGFQVISWVGAEITIV